MGHALRSSAPPSCIQESEIPRPSMVLDIVLPPRKSGAWVTSTTHSPRCLPRPCPEDPIPLARVASTPGEPSRSVPCQTTSK